MNALQRARSTESLHGCVLPIEDDSVIGCSAEPTRTEDGTEKVVAVLEHVAFEVFHGHAALVFFPSEVVLLSAGDGLGVAGLCDALGLGGA